MIPSELPRFMKALTVLFDTLGYPMTPTRMEGFWQALQDLPLADLERACFVGMKSLTFQPKPADLRKLAGRSEISLEDRAAIAWHHVRETIGKTSGYASVDFDDRVINAVIRDMGGWERLSGLSSDELTRFTGRDFMKTYAVFAAHPEGLSDEATRYLPGLHAINCDPRFSDKLPKSPLMISTGLPLLPGMSPRQIEANAHT